MKIITKNIIFPTNYPQGLNLHMQPQMYRVGTTDSGNIYKVLAILICLQ